MVGISVPALLLLDDLLAVLDQLADEERDIGVIGSGAAAVEVRDRLRGHHAPEGLLLLEGDDGTKVFLLLEGFDLGFGRADGLGDENQVSVLCLDVGDAPRFEG